MPNVHGIERRRRKELAAENFFFFFLKERKRTKPNKKRDKSLMRLGKFQPIILSLPNKNRVFYT